MSILKDLDPRYAKIDAARAREARKRKLAIPLLALTGLGCASLAWLVITNTGVAQPQIQLASAKTAQVIAGSTTPGIDSTPRPNPPEQNALIRDQQISSLHGDSNAPISQTPISGQKDKGSSSARPNAQQNPSNPPLAAPERNITVAKGQKKWTRKKFSQKSRIHNPASKREMRPEQRDIDIISAIVK